MRHAALRFKQPRDRPGPACKNVVAKACSRQNNEMLELLEIGRNEYEAFSPRASLHSKQSLNRIPFFREAT
jgi:hypothetical protein